MSNTIDKSPKIASAIYVITSFFNDQEPLKWKLRSLSSDLVSGALVLKDNIRVKNITTEISVLMSLAKNAGLVSSSNFELLNGEVGKYMESLGVVDEIRGILSSPVEAISAATPSSVAPLQPSTPAPTPSLPRPIASNPAREVKDNRTPSPRKNNRQTVILGLIRKNGEIMIKDVVPLVVGCSEKTIQRELLAMVKAGILRKIGEKRWSRYALA